MCKMCWMAATHGVSFRNAWANWVNIEYIVIDLKFIHKFCRFMTLNAKEMVHFVAKCGNNYNFRFQGTFCAPFSRQLFHRLPFHVWTFSQMILSSKRHFSAYVSNKRHPPKHCSVMGFCDLGAIRNRWVATFLLLLLSLHGSQVVSFKCLTFKY